MKKLWAGILIFVLVLSFSTAVFADIDDGFIIGRNSVNVGK